MFSKTSFKNTLYFMDSYKLILLVLGFGMSSFVGFLATWEQLNLLTTYYFGLNLKFLGAFFAALAVLLFLFFSCHLFTHFFSNDKGIVPFSLLNIVAGLLSLFASVGFIVLLFHSSTFFCLWIGFTLGLGFFTSLLVYSILFILGLLS